MGGGGRHSLLLHFAARLGNKVQFLTSHGPLTKSGRRSFAFTLAEVLITLGIIGVVAAITLPAVINDIQNKHFRVKWRKTFSEISNAMLLISEHEPLAEDASEKTIAASFAKYLKNTKVCEEGKAVEEGCLRESYPIYMKNGTTIYDIFDKIGGGTSCIKLANGAVLSLDSIVVMVDVNGSNKPNIIGTDIFAAMIDIKKNVVRPAIGHKQNWGAVDGQTAWINGSVLLPTTGDGTCYGENSDSLGWGCSAYYLINDK